MKSKVFKFATFFSLLVLSANKPAFCVTEAGERTHKEIKSPTTNVFVQHNITEIALNKPSNNEEIEAVNFTADELQNDELNNILTATGNVEIKYSGMHLTTDKIIYDQNTDIITAIGNVIMHSDDGTIIYGDKVLLSDKMTTGQMDNIKVLLADKSHITAERFNKKDNNTKTMANATYTACDLCDNTKPTWQIYARKVQQDEESKNVYYNDAIIRIKDVPVFYTPFFTHPDPSVKRRSGLLAPTIGSSNYLGAIIQPRYFWAINDNTNILLSPIYSSDKGVIFGGNYKQYFYNGNVDIAGTFLKDNANNRPTNRGNIFSGGRYDINDYWRVKYDYKYVSDYIYLKELSQPYQDDAWLTSNLSFERFDGRDYASIEAYYYKILSYNLHRSNVSQFRKINNNRPTVAPLIDVEIYSDPSSIGSYFKNQFNTASIYQPDDVETHRLTSINSWELPYTTAFGEKYRIVASLKSDAYYVDKYAYTQNQTYTGAVTRFFPQLGVDWRLPFVRANDNSRQIVEPVVVGVLAPNGDNKADKIPNLDSQDVYFDDTNVLDLDRYSGYDRNDSGSRLSYGLRWSSYGDRFGRTAAFIAQSYQNNNKTSFTQSLDDENKSHFSDLVGRINAEPNDYLSLNYRYRLDKETLDAKYSELGTRFGPSFLKAYVSYIFLQGNTYYNDLYSERKELYTSLKAQLSEFWSVGIYNLQDLTEKSRGSLEHGGDLTYEDECSKLVTNIKKYNSSDPDLNNSYEFTITFYLKTLGSFGS